MYTRKLYLDRIRPYLDKPVVKVLSGMRRVGKSYLMRQIINLLRDDGVPEANILYIDKESLEFEDIATHRDLNEAVTTALAKRKGRRFLLVDEIQEITDWEKEKLYVQVAYLLATPEVIEREFSVLRAIPDNYPKLVLSMDTAFGADIEGVQRRNLAEFLTGTE